jgi:hypothetical protein
MVKQRKSLFQKIISTVLVLTAVLMFVTMSDSITGRVIGDSKSVSLLDLFILLFASAIFTAGIWVLMDNDFNRSIFKKKR